MRWGTLLIGILFATLILWLGSTFVRAHQAPSGWTYPEECCSHTMDCAPISYEVVHIGPDGYTVHIFPGMHHRAYVEQFYTFEYDDYNLKKSGDQEYHLCLGENTSKVRNTIRCLYVPAGSV